MSSRVYHSYGEGRVDVYPFKLDDFKEMCRLCLVKRDKASPESHDYMRWYRNYVMLILGCNTGCRIETLLQLRPKNIAGGFVRITEYKTNKTLKYQLNDKVMNVVSDYMEFLNITDKEYIFHTFKNTTKPMTREQAYRIIKSLGDEVGIKYNIGCHSLRKSYGRFTYDVTHDIHLVQRMLDHSSSMITQHYICLEDEVVTKARGESAWGFEE